MMKTRLPLLALLFLFAHAVLIAAPAAAQSSSPSDVGDSARPVVVETKFASVSSGYTGSAMLVIEYPWTRHARPSVEVRMFAEDEPDDYRVRPLYFLKDFMTGEMNVAVYRGQVAAESVRRVTPISKNDVEFDVIGDRNSLGKAAVGVYCRTKTPSDEFKTVNRAAFGLLDAWAVDRGTLHLELPPEYFAEPGRMRIWLLRGAETVWSEVVQWPGVEE